MTDAENHAANVRLAAAIAARGRRGRARRRLRGRPLVVRAGLRRARRGARRDRVRLGDGVRPARGLPAHRRSSTTWCARSTGSRSAPALAAPRRCVITTTSRPSTSRIDWIGSRAWRRRRAASTGWSPSSTRSSRSRSRCSSCRWSNRWRRRRAPGFPPAEFLSDNAYGLLAAAISFAVIARLWLAHHALFEHVIGYTPAARGPHDPVGRHHRVPAAADGHRRRVRPRSRVGGALHRDDGAEQPAPHAHRALRPRSSRPPGPGLADDRRGRAGVDDDHRRLHRRPRRRPARARLVVLVVVRAVRGRPGRPRARGAARR